MIETPEKPEDKVVLGVIKALYRFRIRSSPVVISPPLLLGKHRLT
jgi:hypothetical protein